MPSLFLCRRSARPSLLIAICSIRQEMQPSRKNKNMPRLAKLILLPWWTMQLATGAKSFIDNPLIGSSRLNALGLHVGRVRLAQ